VAVLLEVDGARVYLVPRRGQDEIPLLSGREAVVGGAKRQFPPKHLDVWMHPVEPRQIEANVVESSELQPVHPLDGSLDGDRGVDLRASTFLPGLVADLDFDSPVAENEDDGRNRHRCQLEDDAGHGCRGRSSEREAVELTIAERREEPQKLAAEGSIARESKRDKPE